MHPMVSKFESYFIMPVSTLIYLHYDRILHFLVYIEDIDIRCNGKYITNESYFNQGLDFYIFSDDTWLILFFKDTFDKLFFYVDEFFEWIIVVI